MNSASKDGVRGRPWVGVKFTCCNVYTRIYRDRTGAAYVGRCPKCMQQVRMRIAAGGSRSRFFNTT